MSDLYTLTEKEEEELFTFLYRILSTLNKKSMSKIWGSVFKLRDKLEERLKQRMEQDDD